MKVFNVITSYPNQGGSHGVTTYQGGEGFREYSLAMVTSRKPAVRFSLTHSTVFARPFTQLSDKLKRRSHAIPFLRKCHFGISCRRILRVLKQATPFMHRRTYLKNCSLEETRTWALLSLITFPITCINIFITNMTRKDSVI